MKGSIDQIIKDYVLDLISDQEDLFLVDVIKKGKQSGGKVIVLLDGDNGLPIEKCVEISRAISRCIDEEVELDEPMTYEVSSPGLDHPLKLVRQYHKNIGKSIKVTFKDQQEYTGELLKVDDKSILIEIPGTKKKQPEQMQISFEEILKTVVVVSFK
ncbi:ribosome maturation factor RimP [Reichenbachiella versicolor]|uniref:ribosome maturation factor RimP n=1 Tax=Reichenbachiella versicolor TaxID=1821036 RepID=UPI0013A58F86|nr:hypothetical protein [Reichenbachiella versicolor]